MSLVRLIRTHLGPYRRLLGVVLVLQAIQTAAALTLPTLNADIIDNGVLRGDNGYIWRTGAIMLGFSLVQIVFAVGAGVLVFLIRQYGGYPEGVCYSIIIMNTAVPLIDRFTRPRIYGAVESDEEAA